MWRKCVLFCLGSCWVILGLSAECKGGEVGSTDRMVREDLKTAYQIAQTVFSDDPTGSLTMSGLQGYGFKSTENVAIKILDGRKDYLKIRGRSETGHRIYELNETGEILTRSRKKKDR